MPWPIYLALKQLFPTGRVSFFTVISVAGVTLGVAALLVTSSVMGGFGHEIERMTVETQGDLTIRGSHPILNQEPVARLLAATPEVQAWTPHAQGFVMLDFERRPSFPTITGYDLEKLHATIPLQRYLIAGSFDDLDDDSVLVSSILAANNGVRVGSTVSLYTPLMLDRMKENEVLLPREVRVAGIFEVGHQHLDSATLVCTLRLMQDLYGLQQAVHGFNVRLKPGADAHAVAARLNAQLPRGVTALTWFEVNRDFQAILAFERSMMILLLALIVVVAAFLIMMGLMTQVVRKTREIGLLAAMGGRARSIALGYCFQGLFVGVIGTAAGLAIGFAILRNRQAIVGALNELLSNANIFEQFYQFTRLPAYTDPRELAGIILFTLLLSALAGAIAAWRAARLRPVEALRSE